MKKLLAITMAALLAFTAAGCSKKTTADPDVQESSLVIQQIENQSSVVQTESKPEESKAPEEKLSAADFLKSVLQKNADTSEVSARQQLWEAGYTPAEIKEAIEGAFPKSQADAKKEESSIIEESSKLEDSKREDSSKSAEESKSETSQNAQTEESKQNQQASSGGSGNGSSNGSTASSGGSSSSSSESQSQQGQGSQGGSSSGGSTASSEGTSSSSDTGSESQTQQPAPQPQEQPSQPSQEAQQPSQPEQPAHTHTWVDVTTTVHHDAVTEEVWVVDQPAWDEEVVKTEIQQVHKCKCRCGQLFDSDADWRVHAESIPDDEFDAHSGWGSTYVTEEVVVGTETVHHEEVGHYETRTVTEAWDETVVTGQKCSECGATK